MVSIDFTKLKTQYAKNYQQLDYLNIMPLYDYHPWDSGNNPNIDKITNTILNLKTKKPEKFRFRDQAVNFFSKVMKTQLLGLNCANSKSFCVVPSHEKDKVCVGLLKLMDNLSADFGFINTNNLIRRTNTVAKAATGGDRSLQHHLNSLEVINVQHVHNQVIYLFDDISSTGNSLKACKSLLMSAGALKVVMISLGQTY